MSARRLRRLAGRAAFVLLLLAIAIYTVFPFYWAIVTSLKSGSALFGADPIPMQPAWDNYAAVFRDRPFGRNILNSVIVAASVVAVSLGLGLTAAFALGRVAFRGRGLLHRRPGMRRRLRRTAGFHAFDVQNQGSP